MVLTAERGSFLTLLYPAFSVAVPHPLQIRLPLAYPVASHDVEAARFLSTWIELKKRDGTIQALYDHWILGKDAKPKAPRWSILRDVLGSEGVRPLAASRGAGVALASLVVASLAPGLRAQDLAPRAYVITPLRSNAVTLGYR